MMGSFLSRGMGYLVFSYFVLSLYEEEPLGFLNLVTVYIFIKYLFLRRGDKGSTIKIMSGAPVAHYWFHCYKYHQYFPEISTDHSRNSLNRSSRNPVYWYKFKWLT